MSDTDKLRPWHAGLPCDGTTPEEMSRRMLEALRKESAVPVEIDAEKNATDDVSFEAPTLTDWPPIPQPPRDPVFDGIPDGPVSTIAVTDDDREVWRIWQIIYEPFSMARARKTPLDLANEGLMIFGGV